MFSETLDPEDNQAKIALFQKQLAMLHLKVEGHDIYNNTITIENEKRLEWFARHH